MVLPKPLGGTHLYRKVRDRSSYAFANVSVAVVVADGVQRFAFGGLAHRPWRVEAAERETSPEAIAEAVLAGARPSSQNAYKLKLTQRTLAAVLQEARS